MTGQDGTPAALPAAGLAAPASGSPPVGNRSAAFSDYDRAVWAWVCSWPCWSALRFGTGRWLLVLGLIWLGYLGVANVLSFDRTWNRIQEDQHFAAEAGLPGLGPVVALAKQGVDPARPITSSVLEALVFDRRDWHIVSCSDTGPETSGREIVIEVRYLECYSEQESLRVMASVWEPLAIALAVQKSKANVRLYVNNAHGEFALAKGLAKPGQPNGGLDEALVKFAK